MYMYLDGNEVRQALVGDSFGQEGFTTARRSIEQHSLGWGHAKLKELLRVLNGILWKT